MADVLTADALSFGLKLRLMSLSTIKSKLSTVLVGARIGRYLIVETPKVGGVPVKLDDETNWSVNYINQGQVYTFETSVIGSILRPYSLTFLRYPPETVIAPLRVGRRYPVNIPAVVNGPAPPDNSAARPEDQPGSESLPGRIKGLVVDISSGGCRLGSTVELPIGSQLLLTLYLPDNKIIGGVMAEVKSSQESAGTYFSGLLFTGFTREEGQMMFNEFMDSLEKMPIRL